MNGNGQLKLSVSEIQGYAASLKNYAAQLEEQIKTVMQKIQGLESNQEFRTVAGSVQFYEKAQQFNANTPKFIDAINKFANFLEQYVVTNYQETDQAITQLQSNLEAQLAELQSAGNLGA